MSNPVKPLSQHEEPTPFLQFQERVLKEAQKMEEDLSCRVGVSFHDVASDVEIHHRPDELFHAASTMKVPVMIEVMRQSEKEKFSLEDTLILDPMCPSFIDGSLFECDTSDALKDKLNQEVSIYDLTYQMIIVSDNLATNLLIELVGYKNINHTMRELGVENGYVLRGVQDEEAYRAGMSNRMTPRGLTQLMTAIATDSAATPESCELMRNILLDQKYVNQIPAGVPEGVKVGNKTGSISNTLHDTAIVFAPDGDYSLTILLDQLEDTKLGTERAAGLSKLIWEERATFLATR